MWKRIGVVLVVAAGCQAEQSLEQASTLAELGPVTLDLWIQSDMIWLSVDYELQPDEPCHVLGDDFTGRIGDVQAAPFPGGVVDTASCPNASGGCIPTGLRCDPPFIGLYDLPHELDRTLVLGDASRTIECQLGDALLTRTVTRVPDGSWDVSAGKELTVQWAPAGDLARFTPKVWFVEWQRNPLPVAHRIDGNHITFEVPSFVRPGTHGFMITAIGDVPTTLKGCSAPNTRTYAYSVEQYVNVM
jgi:hypothetical protein